MSSTRTKLRVETVKKKAKVNGEIGNTESQRTQSDRQETSLRALCASVFQESKRTHGRGVGRSAKREGFGVELLAD